MLSATKQAISIQLVTTVVHCYVTLSLQTLISLGRLSFLLLLLGNNCGKPNSFGEMSPRVGRLAGERKKEGGGGRLVAGWRGSFSF